MKNQQLAAPSPNGSRTSGVGYKAMVWLNKASHHRVFYDLNEKEAKWLRGIAGAYGMTIPVFTRALQNDELPGAAVEGAAAMFTVTCSDPDVWRHLGAIAKWDESANAEQACIEAILRDLETLNSGALFDPKTGAALCWKREVTDLQLRTNVKGYCPKPRERGYALDGNDVNKVAKEAAEAALRPADNRSARRSRNELEKLHGEPARSPLARSFCARQYRRRLAFNDRPIDAIRNDRRGHRDGDSGRSA